MLLLLFLETCCNIDKHRVLCPPSRLGGFVGKKVFIYGFVSSSIKDGLCDQEKQRVSRALTHAMGVAPGFGRGEHRVVCIPCL